MKEIDYKFQMVENIQKMVEFSMNELESDRKSQLSKLAPIITKIKFWRNAMLGSITLIITILMSFVNQNLELVLFFLILLIEVSIFVFAISRILEGRYQKYSAELDQTYEYIIMKHNSVLGISSNLYESLHLLSIYRLHIIHQVFFLIVSVKEELYIEFMKLSNSHWFSKYTRLEFYKTAFLLDELMTSIFFSKLSVIRDSLNNDQLVTNLYRGYFNESHNFIIRKRQAITVFNRKLTLLNKTFYHDDGKNNGGIAVKGIELKPEINNKIIGKSHYQENH